MTSTPRTMSARVGRTVVTMACTIGVALGAMTMAAPAAHAIAEKDIKAECKDAGGTYGTGMTPAPDNHRISWCDNAGGEKMRDYYDNGTPVGSVPMPRDRSVILVPTRPIDKVELNH